MTIEKLRAYGADVDEGLTRCFKKEDFYLKLVNMLKEEKGFDALEAALKENDLKAAFESAHALKGVLSNLAITPLNEPIKEITELLRANTEMDYSELMEKIRQEKDKFFALYED